MNLLPIRILEGVPVEAHHGPSREVIRFVLDKGHILLDNVIDILKTRVSLEELLEEGGLRVPFLNIG